MEDLTLAIIVHCYNEGNIITETNNILNNLLIDLKQKKIISQKSYISYIDDGSTDTTWNEICKINKKGIKLSKNFGHQNALFAGLLENEADIYITIDADLQDDTTLIEKMVNEHKAGNEIVYGIRNNRDCDSWFKKFCANSYYKFCEIIGMNIIPQHADYRLVSKKIVNIIRNYKESNLFLRGRISNLGFKTSKLYYSRQARIGGVPKYTLVKSINLAIDGITSFSIKPLRFISILGLLCFFFAVFMSIHALWVYINAKIVPGWTSIFISLYFIGGIQLLSIGIIGEYLGKIYIETKNQPLYIVEKNLNDC